PTTTTSARLMPAMLSAPRKESARLAWFVAISAFGGHWRRGGPARIRADFAAAIGLRAAARPARRPDPRRQGRRQHLHRASGRHSWAPRRRPDDDLRRRPGQEAALLEVPRPRRRDGKPTAS